ncbi:MAG: hypothetical protein R2795_25390 [Saprospiraceae bacterium]
MKPPMKYHLQSEKLEPENAWNLSCIGWVYFVNNNLTSSKKYFEEVINVEIDKHALMNLGHIALCQEQKQLAMNYYQDSIMKFEDVRTFIEGFKDDFQYVRRNDIEGKSILKFWNN